jgi:uncharacterized coiled-coil DUF342 family protein
MFFSRLAGVLMAQKDSLRDTLHERLDKLSEQLDQAWDEAEQAYRDLAEQQQARRKEFRAVALEYQRNWQELSEKAIRYCAKRAGSLPPPRENYSEPRCASLPA